MKFEDGSTFILKKIIERLKTLNLPETDVEIGIGSGERQRQQW